MALTAVMMFMFPRAAQHKLYYRVPLPASAHKRNVQSYHYLLYNINLYLKIHINCFKTYNYNTARVHITHSVNPEGKELNQPLSGGGRGEGGGESIAETAINFLIYSAT